MLREMIREFAQRMMDAEVEVRCNAGYGEVTPQRVNSRNEYRVAFRDGQRAVAAAVLLGEPVLDGVAAEPAASAAGEHHGTFPAGPSRPGVIRPQTPLWGQSCQKA